MTRTWFVEGVWWTGNKFDTGPESMPYAEALRDFRRMRNNPAVKRVRLIEETRIRRVVKDAKLPKAKVKP